MKKEENTKPAYKKDYLYKAYLGKEYLWLAFSVISVIIAVYQLIAGKSREEAIYFVALTFLAGLFYSFNRFRRIKFEKRAEEAEQKKN